MAYCNNSSASAAAAAVLDGGGSNQENSTSYEGVWKRKSKWVTKIRDPIKKRSIWLGTFASPEEASRVYQAKKIELEEKVEAAAAEKKNKRKRNIPIIVADDLLSQQIQINQGIEGINGVEESEEKKRKLNRPTLVPDESDSQEIERKTEDSVFDEEIEAASSDNGGAKGTESESESSSLSDERMEDGDILVRFGPVMINKQGFILGEFKWIDDLSII